MTVKFKLHAIASVATLVLISSAVVAQTAVPATPQTSPVGRWHTIDDKTKKPRAQIHITEAGGVLTGKIEKRLDPDAKPDDKCDKCSDDRKDKSVLGLEIIRKVKKLDDPGVWGAGEILDPENGKLYKATLTPQDGGKRLDVRGSFGPFGRTQTWVRVE